MADLIHIATDIPGIHLEVEPEPCSDRSWRFSVVYKFSNGSFIELGGWRVDNRFCEILPPQYSITNRYTNSSYTRLNGRMSPDIKLDLLQVLQQGISQAVALREQERLEREEKRKARQHA
jgi:hypothetical protein